MPRVGCDHKVDGHFSSPTFDKPDKKLQTIKDRNIMYKQLHVAESQNKNGSQVMKRSQDWFTKQKKK